MHGNMNVKLMFLNVGLRRPFNEKFQACKLGSEPHAKCLPTAVLCVSFEQQWPHTRIFGKIRNKFHNSIFVYSLLGP
jgi:hypothetical protein